MYFFGIGCVLWFDTRGLSLLGAMDDFIAAAETGDAAALEEILAHFEVKRFQVNDRDRLGYTALHYACSNGREEVTVTVQPV